MQEIKKLWLLQEIEKKEKELINACKVNPLLGVLRKSKEDITARQKDFEEVKGKYQKLAQDIKEMENEIAIIMDKQKEILKKLYDGSITNAKELSKMQQQSQQLREQAEKLEERQLKSMEEKERLFVFLKNAQEVLQTNIQDFKTQKMQYDMEKLNLEQELAQLGEEKERLLSEISPALLKKFRERQKSFDGSPVAIVRANRLCSFCRVEIIRSVVENARKNPGRVTCECCGRILYVE